VLQVLIVKTETVQLDRTRRGVGKKLVVVQQHAVLLRGSGSCRRNSYIATNAVEQLESFRPLR
jgi:hypothetical protein